MAAGRIQNRDLLARFADLLDLEGVKRFPAMLDMGDIKVVLDISDRPAIAAPGLGVGEWYGYEISPLISEEVESGYALPLQGSETGTNAFRVDSMIIDIVFASTALLSAYVAAGGRMIIDIGLRRAMGDPGLSPILSSIITPATGQLLHRWSMRGSNATPTGINHACTWTGIVPAVVDPNDPANMLQLTVEISSMDSTSTPLSFPTGTTCTIYTTAREGTNGVPPAP